MVLFRVSSVKAALRMHPLMKNREIETLALARSSASLAAAERGIYSAT